MKKILINQLKYKCVLCGWEYDSELALTDASLIDFHDSESIFCDGEYTITKLYKVVRIEE